MDKRIFENGEEMSLNDLSTKQFLALVDATPSLIYFCDECLCYHVQPEKTLNDVDQWLIDNLAD